MKKSLILFAALLGSYPVVAQNIDFDLPGKTAVGKDTEIGYESWAVPRALTDTKTFGNGVTITVTSAGAASAVGSSWNKTTVESNGHRLIGDEVVACNLDNSNMIQVTSGSTSLVFHISGLTAGTHTLRAYHNDSDKGLTHPDISVSVDGVVVATGVKFTSGATSNKEAGQSFITFNVPESGEVTITYTTTPVDGTTYDRTGVMVNGLEFDATQIVATNPSPATHDFHAGSEDGTVMMTWDGADGAVSHKLVFGTDSATVANSSTYDYEGTDTTFTKTGLKSLQKYWWRVDEVTNDGTVYRGKPWCFQPCHIAFPGAEGYGRYAIGGRGGSVYHVTNLEWNDEPGSLLYGLRDISEPHTIVFDVSGLIVMDYESVFTNPNVTIAGQTAPGKGICIKASNINIGSDDICRFMRFKRGYGRGAETTGNAMGLTGANHTIVDHCTAAWGTDETVSGRGALNVTFQYNMIAEALGIADHKNYPAGTNHGYAATIDGRIGSWHHNLLLNCEGRNWSMGGGMDGQNRPIGGLDLFNNVCYNWHGRTTDGNCHAVNFVNNYYKMGPDTKRKTLFTQDFELKEAEGSYFQAYVNGNIRENKDHTLTTDKRNDTYNQTGYIPKNYKYLLDAPLFESHATIHSAKDAEKIVLSDGGATMPMRDDQHKRVVREAIDGTYTYVGSKSGIKGEIDREEDAGGWETYPEESRPANFDSDKDGMPDWYEDIIGSDKNTANNNDDPDDDGYTLLEDYLEFISHPYILLEPGATTTVNMKPSFLGFYGFNGNKVEPAYSISTDSKAFTATVADSIVTVVAGARNGIGTVLVTVKDKDGTTFSQKLNVAVTGEATRINSITDKNNYQVARREIFTLDGVKVSSMHLDPTQVYVVKETDTMGKVHTMKIMKN